MAKKWQDVGKMKILYPKKVARCGQNQNFVSQKSGKMAKKWQDVGKIKILYPKKHGISYGYDSSYEQLRRISIIPQRILIRRNRKWKQWTRENAQHDSRSRITQRKMTQINWQELNNDFTRVLSQMQTTFFLA